METSFAEIWRLNSVGAPDVPQLRRAARPLNHRGRTSFLPKTGEQVLQPNRTKPSQDSLGQPRYPFQQATPRRAKRQTRPPMQTCWQHGTCGLREYVEIHDNDPSAGLPTETLLRLLLPLNNQVRSSSSLSTLRAEARRARYSEDLTWPFNR